MSNLVTFGIAILILPTLLIALMPLINQVLTDDVIEEINLVFDYVESILGSTNTNLLCAIIAILLIMPFIRWFFSFFKND